MSDADPTSAQSENLQEEVRHYLEEKEKVRAIVGSIGGAASTRIDRILNLVFIVLILGLLAVDVLRHSFGVAKDWLPTLFSLELGVLLVSLKIIYMMHKQAKVEHFQFWILNSIEFRLNEVSRRLQRMEKQTGPAGAEQRGTPATPEPPTGD